MTHETMVVARNYDGFARFLSVSRSLGLVCEDLVVEQEGYRGELGALARAIDKTLCLPIPLV